MTTATRPLPLIIDGVLAVLAADGFVISPGIHPDQATARDSRTDVSAPLVGYIEDDANDTSMSLFHDLPVDADAQRVIDALENAGLNVDWPGRDPDLRIDITLPS